MRASDSLPSYEQLFGELDSRADDNSRSVYSPAAYLADLLRLVEDNFADPSLLRRRPGIKEIPLDAGHTHTEIPYLDIVNEILEGLVGEDPYETLRTLRFPFDMPFSLQHERLRAHLRHLDVAPDELYRMFANPARGDIVAREYLGLSPEDVEMVTTPRVTEADILACYSADPGTTLADLCDIDRFSRATGLTADGLRELLFQRLDPRNAAASRFFIHQGGVRVTVDAEEKRLLWGDGPDPIPPEWFERVNRFVRLARLTGLSFTDLDLVLRTCCGNRIDLAALRVIAVVFHLGRVYDLPIDVVCALAAPMDTLGFGDEARQDLFSRTFNPPPPPGVSQLPPISPVPDAAGADTATCSGDILAAHNAAFRARVARCLAMPESDITETVTRFRRRYSVTPLEQGPFDQREFGLHALSLLHRVARLTGALGISAAELFDVLEAIESDWSLRAYTTFRILIDPSPGTDTHDLDCYRMLEATDSGSALWLAQTLHATVRWMQGTGIDGRELLEILGGPGRSEGGEERLLGLLTTLCREIEPVTAGPDMFVSTRFSQRASRVVYEVLATHLDAVVSARDPRLLSPTPAVEAAAHEALAALAVLTPADFHDLDLGERLAGKIFTSLIRRGHLDAGGTLVADRLPTDGLRLSADFDAHREALFTLIRDLGGDGEGAYFYPSDLAKLDGLNDDERAELYDNLLFHGYLDPSGAVLRPDVFADPDGAAAFRVNADIDHVAPAVLDLLREQVDRFRDERLTLDPAIFADLPATEVPALVESLRFNGYLDRDGVYLDKSAILHLQPGDLALAPRFHAHRPAVLRAMRRQIERFRAGLFTFTPEDFTQIADEAMAQRVMERLEETCTERGRLRPAALRLFADPEGTLDLGEDITPAEAAIVFARIAAILHEQRFYRLDLDALTELGFDDEERTRLIAMLTAAGYLGAELTVAPDRLAYFGDDTNVTQFSLPGLEDYARDIFFLLHSAARELTAGIEQIATEVRERAERQQETLSTVLQDAFGVPAETARAICEAVTGGPAQALETLAAPALEAGDEAGGADEITTVPADSHFRLACRRIRAFALLAAKLNLDATQVAVAFHDQDLVGKFPEPLTLPPGVDRFDALLESADGSVYMFTGDHCWIYSATTHTLTGDGPVPLTEISPRFAGLTGVDAAFTDTDGVEWIIGHGPDGAARSFARRPDGTRWTAEERTWGEIRNVFDAPARIDSAFVDENGRTYLFCGDQYVRYSGADYTTVDEGYPRGVTEWWESEGNTTPLPPAFRTRIDACFQDSRLRQAGGGRTHLFSGDRWLAVGDGQGERPITSWGRVRNALTASGRIDASYVAGPALYLFAGDQVFRYDDSVENDDVHVVDGYPRRIETHLPGVPAEFAGALDAAFADGDGVVHLFKNGRTASVAPDGTLLPLTGDGAVVVPTAQRWGLLGPVFPTGGVDAAFTGLDGRTYLFSGDRYIRYSGADYSVVDLGYPRAVAGDWGGLRRVTAAFVMDQRTYLFGTAGLLLELPVEHEHDLNAGYLSPAFRRRLLEHGISFGKDATVTGQSPTWQLTAEGGVTLTVTRTATRLAVHVDETCQTLFHVRYSTRDYTTPDPGYPRPLGDNWWNLPAALAHDPAFARVDAVFRDAEDRIHLFSGDRFAVFDARRRWWSEPRSLREHWDSIPFPAVDAAFVGSDGRTYIFHGDRYIRYSTGDYTRVDDRYPAPITPFWGNVDNIIARTGRVDAALVMDVTETVDDTEVTRTFTYLFSGDQYVRYEGRDYSRVQDGYPRSIADLAREPRLGNLHVRLTGGIDAAFADRRTVFLVQGTRCHAVSDTLYRCHDVPALSGVSCAFVEDGTIVAEGPDGWRRHSALEGVAAASAPVRPRTLRAVPPEFRTGLDAVLLGADGNTYLFSGTTCFDVQLNRAYPVEREWGRPRNTLYHRGTVDAAFAGTDGKTYLFGGDQFVVYAGAGPVPESGPLPIAGHWGDLASVTLAYVRHGVTHIFGETADGRARHLVYSGPGYRAPDPGPAPEPAFRNVPEEYRAEGFATPRAVLFEGDTMLLLRDGRVLPFNEATGVWSHPRSFDHIWPGLPDQDDEQLRAAFTGHDGATYFFFGDRFTRYAGGGFSPLTPVRDHWGRSPSLFTADGASGRVDAAFVHRGRVTYLFSGGRYVRYSGPDYRYADPGYPKPIIGELRREEPFANLPETFDDAVADRLAAGGRVLDAVLDGGRTVFLLMGGVCHAVSQDATATYDLDIFGRVRNTIAERNRIDAALATETGTYLFSGDQYVRYSGPDHTFVDDGYPRTIAGSLAAELGLPELPERFHDGIDAAFRGVDGRLYLFKDDHYLRAGADGTRVEPVAGAWGRVANAFTDPGRPPGVDAAFAAPTGELYAFRDGQYVRYRPGEREFAEEGFPRTIRDDWGDLPAAFEEGIDGAFVFRGRTYLVKGDRYVRYSGDRYDAIDRTYPQTFRHRWADAADYRLNDVHVIARFAELARRGPAKEGGLAAFLAAGPETVEDPYRYLADLFGWDAAEVAWVRRHGGFLPAAPGVEDRFEIEFALKLAELFTTAGRLGAPPSLIHAKIWSPIHGGDLSGRDRAAAIADANAVLLDLLARRHDGPEWPDLSRRLHGELNVRKRDALVSAILGHAPDPEIFNGRVPRTSGDLFEHLLIDVDMGGRGTTSRIREAIAATQLYLHRYFLGLERVTPADGQSEEELRARLKRWWGWMRNYRVWEANRKVFLYPENYIRPELRDTKTPAFRELENDLLQGDITMEAVQRAYKRYLDEYTEVSRLAIAGGYVHPTPGGGEGERSLVLFGRTRTAPRRFYYRRAEFRDGDRLSTSWGPWLKVNVQINAEKVYPIFAFDRVFVFWAVAEPVPSADSSRTTLTVRDEGGAQHVSAPAAPQVLTVYYSFYNLNKEWVAAQVLGTSPPRAGQIPDVPLSVRSGPLPGQEPGVEHESIIVSCVLPATSADPSAHVAFALTPELYAVPVSGVDTPVPRQGEIGEILADTESVAETDVVRFNHPLTSSDLHWLSVDHKGGSFLCRPILPAPVEPPAPVPLRGNKEPLPSWDRIDAAFELPDGTRYFFSNATGQYTVIKPGRMRSGPARPIKGAWGEPGNNLIDQGVVDAVLRRGPYTYLFSGDHYYRYSGTPFGPVDRGYPKRLQDNDENLPNWSRVDIAFTSPGGVEHFFSTDRPFVEQNGPSWLGGPRPGHDDRLSFFDDETDAVFVRGEHTFVTRGSVYLRYTGDNYHQPDRGYPRPLAGNRDGLPPWKRIDAAFSFEGVSYFFDNSTKTCLRVPDDGGDGETFPSTELGTRWWTVDAAYVADGHVYLTKDNEFVRHTLGEDGAPLPVADPGYPRTMPRRVDAVLRRHGRRYVFSGDRYGVLEPGMELDDLTEFIPIEGNWGDLPDGFPATFTGVLDAASHLYLFREGAYLAYPNDVPDVRPYEFAMLPRELIRLTTSTAYKLNQRLLAGGIPALLTPETQETNELPAFSLDRSDPTTVMVRRGRVAAEHLPVSSHLDFQSANSVYYWEIFFHAPMLIAQALNDAQRFEDARTWYEYIFDPTEPGAYWRFLPFLAIDVRALAESCAHDLAELRQLGADVSAVTAALETVLARLTALAPAFRDRALSPEDLDYLRELAAPERAAAFTAALDAVTGVTTPDGRAALSRLRERTAMLGELRRQYDLLGDGGRLLATYREDPFDPHAIAQLRPAAYRRAVVMAYIDNLLDWGDMLFRQYTAESVDEARMLYVFAYDLLGKRPDRLDVRPLPPARTYAELTAADAAREPADAVVDALTGGGTLLEGPGAIHAGVANPYFYVPGNSVFAGYWDRVEDRLRKIRESLTIMGISAPLPLFEPPLDPMALVRQTAAGAAPDTLVTGPAVPVPHHRFAFLFRKAQDLAERLRAFGTDLLGALERRDGEELLLLQTRQEKAILDMTREVREAQVQAAMENLNEVKASKEAAQNRIQHYETLIAEGLSPLQEAQVAMMSIASAAHLTASGLKIGSAVAHGAPQILIGAFISGTKVGGDQLGNALDKTSEAAESVGEAMEVLGELLGVRAEQERMAEDWEFQLATAQDDLKQLEYQVAAAEQNLVIAQRELDILTREIEQREEIAAFLRDKFAGAELYGWMAGRLSAAYFQTYRLAHEMARAAELAYRFERGVPDDQESYIGPGYWESRRNGLLAGENLALDLERLGKAYLDADERDLEIVKRVSLRELDPVALLTLKSTGRCEFALTEALFDYDFPGHYRRQIKAVSVVFVGDPGEEVHPSAMLTQLGHRTVLVPDPKAVKHLLDPKGLPPATLRLDWRAHQQIALSDPGPGMEDYGVFEPRPDDDRYLPFEGTGAVSTWRLELTGRRAFDRPDRLRDVVIIVRYTARHGGEVFANAVKGMLKPYPASRFFNVATDFPREWAAFLDGDDGELVLPLTPEMFPGMSGRQITGIYPAYDLTDTGTARFLLGGSRDAPLTAGVYLPTPGLSVAEESALLLVLDGDKTALRDFGLVLTYRAGVR